VLSMRPKTARNKYFIMKDAGKDIVPGL